MVTSIVHDVLAVSPSIRIVPPSHTVRSRFLGTTVDVLRGGCCCTSVARLAPGPTSDRTSISLLSLQEQLRLNRKAQLAWGHVEGAIRPITSSGSPLRATSFSLAAPGPPSCCCICRSPGRSVR